MLVASLLLLLWPATPSHAQKAVPPTPASAGVTFTNRPTKTASLPGVPIPSPTKRRAGFLAGSGLAILSLLGLAAGLALVRTFKR